MHNRNEFVAGLFVLSLCGFVAGGIGLARYVDYRLNARPAMMQLANPDEDVLLYEDDWGARTLDVRYVSAAGEVVVPNKLVSLDVARKLADGQQLPITYMRNNPARIYYPYERPPNPWPWLILGVVVLPVAFYALKLRKREAGV